MPARAFLGLGSLLLALAVSASAQVSANDARQTKTGNIRGDVLTVDDRPVTNARVEAHDLSTGTLVSTTFTNETGMFELYNIRAGSYEIVVSSGVDEVKERVDVNQLEAPVRLRINSHAGPTDNSATVSVSKFKVPEKAQKEFEKGADAFQKNKLEEAHKHIDRALLIHPNYAEALVIRGLLSVEAKDVRAGENDLQAAITADPSYGMAYIAMGALQNQEHQYDNAKRSLERGTALSPTSWQGYFELGKTAMGLKDYQAAVKYVERAQGLVKDDYPPIHLVKAHALLGLNQYEQALAELEQFLSRDPNSPNAQYARSTLDKTRAFLATNNGSK